jgi:hypothetical protein
MNEAINHRHEGGDDHNRDYKYRQALSCSHVLAHELNIAPILSGLALNRWRTLTSGLFAF